MTTEYIDRLREDVEHAKARLEVAERALRDALLEVDPKYFDEFLILTETLVDVDTGYGG